MGKYWAIILLILVFLFCTNAGPGFAKLQTLGETELDDIRGQSGISFAIKNVEIFQNIDRYAYCATDNGYIDLRNIQVDTLQLNYDFGTALTSTGIMHFDLATCQIAPIDDWDLSTNPSTDFDDTYKTMSLWHVPNWKQNLTYTISDIYFTDGTLTDPYNLGELLIGSIDTPSFHYYSAPHLNSGVDWEYGFEAHIDKIEYAYKVDPPNCETLAINDIHIGSSFGFGTAGDDPSDPTTWNTQDIGEFRIGYMFGSLSSGNPKMAHSRPAQFDVGICGDGSGDLSNYQSARFILPMSGSLRFESVDFGGTDFGPGAIDGLEVYRLEVFLVP